MFAFPSLDLLASVLVLCAGCAGPRPTETALLSLPIQDLDGVVAEAGVVLDSEVSTDRNGSLRITTEEPTTVPLYELGQLEIPSPGRGYVAYRASLKAEDLDGVAYLEAAAPTTPRSDELTTQASPTRVSGTSNWSRHEAPLFLADGQIPSRLLLNLVVEGNGTVWVDAVRVLWVGFPH